MAVAADRECPRSRLPSRPPPPFERRCREDASRHRLVAPPAPITTIATETIKTAAAPVTRVVTRAKPVAKKTVRRATTTRPRAAVTDKTTTSVTTTPN